MNISKSESYNLSPEQYLHKFQTPHSTISQRGKKDSHESETEFLQQILESYNENSQTLKIKEQAIKVIQQIVKHWMKGIFEAEYRIDSYKSKQDDSKKDQIITFQKLLQLGYGLKIFGSYSLRTNSYDADIDMVCVVPEFINREGHFHQILAKQLKKSEKIHNLFSIPEALIPLIKFSFLDVQIDLLISRIPIGYIKNNPNFFHGQAKSTRQIKEKELKSINGYRTSLYIQKNIKNYKNYQVVLKAIKMWAKNKGIYSQIYGFIGGAALSIMLAKICQLYPNYSPLQLLDRFFFIYANWVWSIPIQVQISDLEEKAQGGLQIYTPLEPQINAAHYVSKVTCHITRKFLRQGSKLIQTINRSKKQFKQDKENHLRNQKEWKQLFQPIDFFKVYSNYIQLSIMGNTLEDFIAWKGNVQSKLRKFLRYLQIQIQNIQFIEIHPYPMHFEAKHSNYKYCSKYYFGIRCESNPNLNDNCQIDISNSVRSFLQLLQNYPEIHKVPKELNIGFNFLQQKDIDPKFRQKILKY